MYLNGTVNLRRVDFIMSLNHSFEHKECLVSEKMSPLVFIHFVGTIFKYLKSYCKSICKRACAVSGHKKFLTQFRASMQYIRIYLMQRHKLPDYEFKVLFQFYNRLCGIVWYKV